MIKLFRIVFKLLLSLSAVLYSIYGYSSGEGIEAEITTDASNVMQMEPVVINLTVRNVANEKRGIIPIGIGRYGQKFLAVFVKGQQDINYKRVMYPDIHTGATKAMSRVKSFPIIYLDPAEKANYSFQLHYDFPGPTHRRWLFEKPGRYQIKIMIYEIRGSGASKLITSETPKSEVYSNEIEIFVDESSSELDKEALTAFRRIDNEYFLFVDDINLSALSEHTKTYYDSKVFIGKYFDSYLSARVKSYIKGEDNAIEEYKTKVEVIKKNQEREAKRLEERRIQEKQFYEQLTDQQKKDLAVAQAVLKEITVEQKIEVNIPLAEIESKDERNGEEVSVPETISIGMRMVLAIFLLGVLSIVAIYLKRSRNK